MDSVETLVRRLDELEKKRDAMRERCKKVKEIMLKRFDALSVYESNSLKINNGDYFYVKFVDGKIVGFILFTSGYRTQCEFYQLMRERTEFGTDENETTMPPGYRADRRTASFMGVVPWQCHFPHWDGNETMFTIDESGVNIVWGGEGCV